MKYLDKWENLEGTEKMYLQVSDQFKSSIKLNQYKQFNTFAIHCIFKNVSIFPLFHFKNL